MAPHMTLAQRLPTFPWDTIAGYRERAAGHPDGLIDLSVGAPVDRVTAAVRRALADTSDAPGYPSPQGVAALRGAYADYLARAHGVDVDPSDTTATVGSKELISTLPLHLGFGPGDIVVIPHLAYPTYEVGARIAGSTVVRADSAAACVEAISTERSAGDERRILVWLNSPSNPTGRMSDAEELAAWVRWARGNDAIVASDECYIDFGWDAEPQSILDPEISGSDRTGLLAVHSLSKRSNLAGYRLGFVTGDPELIADLVTIRKHCGLIVPQPVQMAGVAAFSDDAPVLAQRNRYLERRAVLSGALCRAGFQIDHSQAGLYLWATRGESAMDTVETLSDLGILVTPGSFYGPTGARHVRLALTATDQRIAAAAARIAQELAR